MKLIIAQKWFPFLGFLLFIPSLLLNLYFYQQSQKNAIGNKVIEVLDGDTVLLEQDVRLRLRHIDAPELQYCGGGEAKKILTDS